MATRGEEGAEERNGDDVSMNKDDFKTRLRRVAVLDVDSRRQCVRT